MNVPSRGIHSCRTTSPESCRSILSESVNENRERLKKCHTFQYGLKTSVVLFSMISKNCLLFQLMKQKSVYSNQEKTFQTASIHKSSVLNDKTTMLNDKTPPLNSETTLMICLYIFNFRCMLPYSWNYSSKFFKISFLFTDIIV